MKRLVLDTNVLLSALMVPASPTAGIPSLWRDQKVTFLIASERIDEITRVTSYPRIRALLHPALAGRLVDRLRDVATVVENLPIVDRSPDPDDNYLRAIAERGEAQFPVTGDKPLLGLKRHKSTRIVTPAELLQLLKEGGK